MTEDLEEISEGDLKEIRDRPSKFVERVIGLEPYDYQKDVLDVKDDRIAFVSGRQVGKSRTASWFALHFALTNPDTTILITAPSRRQSSNLFKQIRKEMNSSEIEDQQWGVTRKTRTIIEFNNGSEIVCLPAGDDGSTIRGYTADLIVVDEAAFVPDPVFYQALMPMLATTNGKMVLLSTPYGSSGFLYEAFHDQLEDNYYTNRVASYRNPQVSDDFIEAQQRQLSSTDFKQEILGVFVESASSFFSEDVVDGAMKLPNRRSSKRCFLGVDLARHGDDRSVFVSIDGNGNVFNIESHQDKALTEAIGRVKFLNQQFGYHKILIDETSLGGGVVDVLKQDLGSNVIKGFTFSTKSRKDIYNTLKAHMEADEIALPNHSDTKKELLSLEMEFTTQGKMKIVHPEGGHDDHADALALAVRAFDRFGAPRQSSPVSI